MATLFVRHNVKDYTAWREAYDAFDGERRAMGVTSYGVYQLDDNPNDVTFYHEFATMDSAAGLRRQSAVARSHAGRRRR